MENRKPYDLKGIIMIYNLLQVAANLYLFITVSAYNLYRVIPRVINN